MKIYAVYINGSIIYANKKEDLKVYCELRHDMIDPDISKLNINDEVYQELVTNEDTNLLVNLKETDGFPLLMKEFELIFSEHEVFNLLVFLHHQSLLIENDITKYTNCSIYNLFIIIGDKFNKLFSSAEVEYEISMYHLYESFIYDRESRLWNHKFIDYKATKRKDIKMDKGEKIAKIENFVKKLEYDYAVLERTSKVILLSDKEEEIITANLAELKKVIKKIKKCKTFEEIDKYIKVKKILKEARW